MSNNKPEKCTNTQADLPGVGAIIIQNVELPRRDQLTAVDARLDGPQPPQDADLLHVTDHGADLEPLEFGVDRMEAAHQVLEEEFERLG